MSVTDGGARLTRSELAWELAEVFDELSIDSINEVLAKNVPLETLEFMAAYAEDFAEANALAATAGRRIPNLMILGYLLRVVEERLLEDDDA
jgi:hypothetical protein